MDNFKKYIQENKSKFDSELPSNSLWDRIEQDLELPKTDKKIFPIWKWMAAAACFAVVFFSLYFLVEKNKNNSDVPTFAKKTIPVIEQMKEDKQINSIPEKLTANVPNVNSNISETIQKKDNYKTAKKTNKSQPQYVVADVEVGNFSQVIEYQRRYISTLPIYGQKPSYFNDFKQQIKQMDNDEKDVRNEIRKHGLNPNQIELLINIYQQKITLLKQLNQEILRVNKSFYQNHVQKDSIRTEDPHFLNI